jgi:hypothetical protein
VKVNNVPLAVGTNAVLGYNSNSPTPQPAIGPQGTQIPYGTGAVAITINNINGTSMSGVLLQSSLDGGTTWSDLTGTIQKTNAAWTNGSSTIGNGVVVAIICPIPNGTNLVQVLCTGLTGTAFVNFATIPAPVINYPLA